MFPKMKFWGASKRPNRSSSRRSRAARFEQLEYRRVLTATSPVDPLVMAGLVGPDLIVSSSAPEVNVSVIEDGGVITVSGNVQNYYGTDGNLDRIQTDINTTGNHSATFTAPSRDVKITLKGVDSWLNVGDTSDGVTVGRDLIISMPATTTSTQLAYDSVLSETHLNLDVDTVTVGRNLTITTGTLTTSEAAVIDVTNTLVTKGNLSITTNGAVPNMIGVSATTVIGNASITTGAGDDLIAVVETFVSSRLTISAGAGDNSVLCTDDFSETLDSSLQTFVTVHEVFGDGQDDELTDLCVQQLADDLETASSDGFSFEAQNANIYVLNGDNVIDVHDADVIGGNLVISAGNGTNVIAVTNANVRGISPLTPSGSSAVGNVTITAGNGNNLIILVGLEVGGGLSVSTGSGALSSDTGYDLIVATPDVTTVVEQAISDFVSNNPGVFFDPTGSTSPNGVLDIDDLTQEIIDISTTFGFQAYKATITTKDTVDNTAAIDISQGDVASTLTITMGNGNDALALSEFAVGIANETGTATIKLGNGDDTVVIVGVGAEGTDYPYSGAPPTGEMNSFTLTTGNGANTVVVSLDWEGDPGYSGPVYGIDAAVQGYDAVTGGIAGATINAIDAELDAAAQAMVVAYEAISETPASLNASHVYLTIGNSASAGSNTVTLSDITISPLSPEPAATNRMNVIFGGTDNYLYFYDNTWDGAFVDLSGGSSNTDGSTLDEHEGGNEGSNMTVIHFQYFVPDETI